ncbi:FadR/GntR family transcriptional regulator [Nocardia rhamnosiphila]|uniref:FadR/GntR family transcriptional regulator n=1 Tax=Nocardia rhamnosiphila TaxID=426716 RepID=UPI0033E5A6C1
MSDPQTSRPMRKIGQKVLRPREQVEDRIRQMVLSGELNSGEMLPPETALAKQFNVSRTTLREALRSLTTQGLIHKVPGARGGNFVNSVDHHSLGTVVIESLHNLLELGSIAFSEVAEIRQYLEVPAARLAATNRTAKELEQLHEVVEQQKSASVDDPDIPKLDEKFHSLIAQASRNRVLASFVAALHHETEPVHYLDLSPEVGRATVRHHKAIVDAISAKDPDAAEAAIVEHLSYLRVHLAGLDEADQLPSLDTKPGQPEPSSSSAESL